MDTPVPRELPEPDITIAGRFEPAEARRYRHVPFAVPEGVRQIHLRYDYSDRVGSSPLLRDGNTLDIGLFDGAGIAPGSPGFRGWSGSNKDAFTIDHDWATPPYRAGVIDSGTWHVALGPYKVCARGLDYRIRIWFNPGLTPDLPALTRRRPTTRAAPPPAAEPGWLRGDLHCHTLHSDGDSWPVEARYAAAEAGLDFLSVTDHNGANFQRDDGHEDGLPILIPGIEVTTYRGHWNVWGLRRWFEFREPTPEVTERAMHEAAAAGGLVSVNHPKPLGPNWEYGDARGYHAIEVWNGPWLLLNAVALAYWETRLRRGERVVAVAGSDTHQLRGADPDALNTRRLGEPTLWVRVDGPPAVATILAGIRAGRCFISATPAGPQLYVEPAAAGIRVGAVGAAGAVLMLLSERGAVAAAPVGDSDWRRQFPYPPDWRYIRAQLVDSCGAVLALSNPLWPGPRHG